MAGAAHSAKVLQTRRSRFQSKTSMLTGLLCFKIAFFCINLTWEQRISTVTPVCIAQIKAAPRGDDTTFLINNKNVDKVVLIGVIRRKDQKATRISYQIEDHTGSESTLAPIPLPPTLSVIWFLVQSLVLILVLFK